MCEAHEESTHVRSHKARIVYFLSAMRHYAQHLEKQGYRIHYVPLSARDHAGTLAGELAKSIATYHPERLTFIEPGEYRVRQNLIALCESQNIHYTIIPDSHFLCTMEEFRQHAKGRKQLRMEFFYREMRKRTDILMEGNQPVGGEWNYDAENRGSFPKSGPSGLPAPLSFAPDAITQQVIQDVERYFPDHPGSTNHFDWPVTTAEARQALKDFIQHRLPSFGQYQDAMWTQEPWLYHARLSAAMNLKLLHPREVLDAAVQAFEQGHADIASVEGFVRQILGWREYVRGVYWLYMPEYLERNALQANLPLPELYWTADTEMTCLRESIGQTLQYGYAHHIQRLMVIGLFALLLGVRPQAVHEWYLAIYVDAVEWVELPNVLGMSQYGDGGIMASKPYIASGKYIQRMSNYCRHCRYKPDQSTGDNACPFTTLYWDFLIRHANAMEGNPRMTMQLRNLQRLDTSEQSAIQNQAKRIRLQVVGSE